MLSVNIFGVFSSLFLSDFFDKTYQVAYYFDVFLLLRAIILVL